MDAQAPEIFPRGEEATEPAFSGPAWLARLLDPQQVAASDIAIVNVTYAPGCRHGWHRHTQGQVLLVARGVGYQQIRGEAVQVLHPGDVAVCPPNSEHWHGAGPNGEFAHIAISPRASINEPIVMGPVTDEEYGAAVKLAR